MLGKLRTYMLCLLLAGSCGLMAQPHYISVGLRVGAGTFLAKGEQTILFLNRRGYAGFISCRSCGYVVKCPHCDVSLTEHRDGSMQCHYCGYTILNSSTCPECKEDAIRDFGLGSEKVEEYVLNLEMEELLNG